MSRVGPSYIFLSPSPPSSPGLPAQQAMSNQQRARSLQRFLQRRLDQGLAAQPPRELPDWRILETNSNSQLQSIIRNLLQQEMNDDDSNPELDHLVQSALNSIQRSPPPQQQQQRQQPETETTSLAQLDTDSDSDDSDPDGSLFYRTILAGADSRQRRMRILAQDRDRAAADILDIEHLDNGPIWEWALDDDDDDDDDGGDLPGWDIPIVPEEDFNPAPGFQDDDDSGPDDDQPLRIFEAGRAVRSRAREFMDSLALLESDQALSPGAAGAQSRDGATARNGRREEGDNEGVDALSEDELDLILESRVPSAARRRAFTRLQPGERLPVVRGGVGEEPGGGERGGEEEEEEDEEEDWTAGFMLTAEERRARVEMLELSEEERARRRDNADQADEWDDVRRDADRAMRVWRNDPIDVSRRWTWNSNGSRTPRGGATVGTSTSSNTDNSLLRQIITSSSSNNNTGSSSSSRRFESADERELSQRTLTLTAPPVAPVNWRQAAQDLLVSRVRNAADRTSSSTTTLETDADGGAELDSFRLARPAVNASGTPGNGTETRNTTASASRTAAADRAIRAYNAFDWSLHSFSNSTGGGNVTGSGSGNGRIDRERDILAALRASGDPNPIVGDHSGARRANRKTQLLYCGTRTEILPAGFKSAASTTTTTTSADSDETKALYHAGGCGRLVCARAVDFDKTTVTSSSSSGGGGKDGGFLTDLPPPRNVVGDLEGGEESGERVGKAALQRCRSCRTKTFGCLACGNVLGFRVVRACDGCSKSRRSIVEGLLWHYRSGAVTSLPRRMLQAPQKQISLDDSDDEEEGDGDVDGNELEAVLIEEALGSSKSESPEVKVGQRMRWMHRPRPQDDFEDGLVGEVGEWIDGDADYWWVEKTFGNRNSRTVRPPGSRRSVISGGRRSNPLTDAPRRDTLPPRDALDAVFSPRTGQLSRSHAVRIPHRSSRVDRDEPEASNGSSSSNSRRLRSSLSPERRVRQRLDADEVDSADDGEQQRRERILQDVGYGRAFVSTDAGRDSGSRTRRTSGATTFNRRRSLASRGAMGLVGR
ncbi:hypothetical protein T439DRAFT_348322 [Meredithblackwellia eburnea MCA 4105]